MIAALADGPKGRPELECAAIQAHFAPAGVPRVLWELKRAGVIRHARRASRYRKSLYMLAKDFPAELMETLERVGWTWIKQRTSPHGLVLHTFGRGRLKSALARTWEETEERSVDGWRWEAELG